MIMLAQMLGVPDKWIQDNLIWIRKINLVIIHT
jgi:hypothetical protein